MIYVATALVVAVATLSAPLAAQVPPGATPGGALPRVEPAVQPAQRQGELFDIPRVYDRPLALEEGPRIVVTAFKLQGVVDRPDRGVKVEEVLALLDATRNPQPAKGFTVNQLQEAAGKVATYYREHGYILAQAFVPAQQVTNGEVVVQVLEGKLSGVVVEGNKGYSAKTLERPFRALVGEPLDKDSIESALLTLTNYPGVTAFGVLGAGHDVGTTNLTLRVQGEDRFRVETVLDNYGTRFAGEYRGQVALTFNDPLGLADRLKVTGLYARSSSEASHGLYGGVDYEIPLFSPSDSLRFIHLTNAYNVGAAASAVTTADSEGDTRVDEMAYRHDFARTRLGSASIGVAFNLKSATFEAPPAVVYDDKLTTARLDAQWERIDTRFRGVNRVAFAFTRGFNDLFDSLDAYDSMAVAAGTSRVSRLGASGKFNKLSLQLQRLQRLTQFTSLVMRLDGQFTNDPLVSLEQFSMGGPDSVRAYPSAELLAEKGGVASLELITGAPGIGKRPAFGNYTWGQVLQFSVFADYARGELNAPLTSSDRRSAKLAGAGGSVQFSVPGRVFARLDVATPLTNREPANGRDPQYYFRFGTTF
jgi:hemolysin activation/secretion protein